MRVVLAAVFVFFLCLGVCATVFSGSGGHELMEGDSVKLENNSSILASKVAEGYAGLEFLSPYGIKRFSWDVWEKDFGKITILEPLGLKFSVASVKKVEGDGYLVVLNASGLAANLVLKAVLKPGRAFSPGDSVRVSDFVSSAAVENAGELALQNINAVFQLLRNGEAIYYSENVSAIESLGAGKTATARVENASWLLLATRPGAEDNFSIRITIARNQFQETNYSDNELTLPVLFAAPASTATSTPMPTPVVSRTPSTTPTESPPVSVETGPSGGSVDGGTGLVAIFAVVLILAVAAMALVVFGAKGKKAGKG